METSAAFLAKKKRIKKATLRVLSVESVEQNQGERRSGGEDYTPWYISQSTASWPFFVESTGPELKSAPTLDMVMHVGSMKSKKCRT